MRLRYGIAFDFEADSAEHAEALLARFRMLGEQLGAKHITSVELTPQRIRTSRVPDGTYLYLNDDLIGPLPVHPFQCGVTVVRALFQDGLIPNDGALVMYEGNIQVSAQTDFSGRLSYGLPPREV